MTDGSMAADGPEIPLSEMIEMLRQELQKSQEHGKNQAVAFEIDKVELELKVAVSRKAKGEGGVAFWVLKAGGAMEHARDTTHNFKLTLSPVSSSSGGRLKVAKETIEPVSRD